MQPTARANGKLERYHRTIKHDCVRQKTPLTLAEARRVVTEFVQHYNAARLRSALGYVSPADKPCVKPLDALANSHIRTHAIVTGRNRRRLCGDATCRGITRTRRH